VIVNMAPDSTSVHGVPSALNARMEPHGPGIFYRLFKRAGVKRDVPWLFLVPAAICFAVFVIIPAVASIVLSLTDYTGLGQATFVGLRNYATIFSDPQAGAAIRNTLALALFVVVFQNAIGLALALVLEKNFFGRDILRIIFFLPAIVSPVIIAFLWQYIYSPRGALNQALEAAGLDKFTQVWLGDPNLALWAIGVAIVWQVSGYAMVIYIAGLQNIPPELVEAAEIDGTTAWQRFRFIKFPLLAPALTINFVLSLISGLRYFDQILAMTGGGPGYATETIATMIYKQGFVFGKMAYSAAVAVILTLVVAAFSVVQVMLLRRRERF